MRPLISHFILCCFLGTSFLLAQLPPVGIINFYGLREVSEVQVREVLGIEEGHLLPAWAKDAEIVALQSAIAARVEAIPDVQRASVSFSCCGAPKGEMVLNVGIQEGAGPHFDFNPPPQSDIMLPPEIVEDYENFIDAFKEAVLKGDAREDRTQGHSLMDNPRARAFQERFLVHAEQHLERIRDVLSNSADAEQRAMAATVIGYAQDKRMVLDDLESAARDSDDDVRNNAMRALMLIILLGQRRPGLGIEISPSWFIEMLSSLILGDRNKATGALVSLTMSRDEEILRQLREQALPALVEMARWKSGGTSQMAHMLLGRVAGLSEGEIKEAWSKGDRERVISQALKSQ